MRGFRTHSAAVINLFHTIAIQRYILRWWKLTPFAVVIRKDRQHPGSWAINRPDPVERPHAIKKIQCACRCIFHMNVFVFSLVQLVYLGKSFVTVFATDERSEFIFSPLGCRLQHQSDDRFCPIVVPCTAASIVHQHLHRTMRISMPITGSHICLEQIKTVGNV